RMSCTPYHRCERSCSGFFLGTRIPFVIQEIVNSAMAFAGAFLFRYRSWRRVIRFAGIATVALLSPSTYRAETRQLAVRQIYHNAWQLLPSYLLFSAPLSARR